MKAQDVISQLVGTCESMDQQDTFAYTFYGCSKFGGAYCDIDLEKGTLTITKQVLDNDDNVVVKTFAIKATLEPLDT